MPTDTLPELNAAAVIDGYRYTVASHEPNGVTVLAPADDSHDRYTSVRTSELVHEPVLAVWTLPGRLLGKSSGFTVTTEDNS